ncbi:hypothetical protein MJG53_015249 [Ovis ammon polii x Ovis aries]|uniref:Uncharacterized protein n=1 Tax=Ovis ammon polii x Ovis aries TaxID=2918886 RepID=A0ACB9UED3_9CETA|nr:hypothetical protein MJG53_015249 [Ovis ammon polii x Ovis aries]
MGGTRLRIGRQNPFSSPRPHPPSSAPRERMLENQEQEEVITVRVQDPRVQNEGSWNSYVDYKIFLHTNSKAFTAKTSCVRRRYREFVWLRKQLQRNAGLVPVPELPGKSTFFGSSDEFIEKRRQGLQHFLEKVLQSVVLLSDSQLHLFLQSQLSVPEIEACVQGRSSVSVSDAILRYAMSNCGWAQEERRGSSHLAEGDQPKREPANLDICEPGSWAGDGGFEYKKGDMESRFHFHYLFPINRDLAEHNSADKEVDGTANVNEEIDGGCV